MKDVSVGDFRIELMTECSTAITMRLFEFRKKVRTHSLKQNFKWLIYIYILNDAMFISVVWGIFPQLCIHVKKKQHNLQRSNILID